MSEALGFGDRVARYHARRASGQLAAAPLVTGIVPKTAVPQPSPPEQRQRLLAGTDPALIWGDGEMRVVNELLGLPSGMILSKPRVLHLSPSHADFHSDPEHPPQYYGFAIGVIPRISDTRSPLERMYALKGDTEELYLCTDGLLREGRGQRSDEEGISKMAPTYVTGMPRDKAGELVKPRIGIFGYEAPRMVLVDAQPQRGGYMSAKGFSGTYYHQFDRVVTPDSLENVLYSLATNPTTNTERGIYRKLSGPGFIESRY